MRRCYTLLLLASLLCAVSSSVVLAASSSVVISEFRTRGPAGASDEFVELWNKSAASVDISGWLMRGSNAAGTVSTRATVPAGTSIGPGCYFLFVNSGAPGEAVLAAPDQTYSTGITDDGGIAITLPDQTVVDMVGMSLGSAFKEGTPLAPTPGSVEQSYERLPGGVSGNGQDTDDNTADFVYHGASSNPMNSMSCIPTRVMDWTWGQIKTIYR